MHVQCCEAAAKVPLHERRDLISSADTILDISHQCHRVISLVGEIEGNLGNISASIVKHRSKADVQTPASSYDRLFGEWRSMASQQVPAVSCT